MLMWLMCACGPVRRHVGGGRQRRRRGPSRGSFSSLNSTTSSDTSRGGGSGWHVSTAARLAKRPHLTYIMSSRKWQSSFCPSTLLRPRRSVILQQHCMAACLIQSAGLNSCERQYDAPRQGSKSKLAVGCGCQRTWTDRAKAHKPCRPSIGSIVIEVCQTAYACCPMACRVALVAV